MDSKQLEDISSMLRAVLQSTKAGVALTSIQREYQTIVGEPIPFKKLGFPTLEGFLRSLKDVVQVSRGAGNELVVTAVSDQPTAHIASLVKRQKSNKKSKQPSRYSSRRPANRPSSQRYNYSTYPARQKPPTRLPPRPTPSTHKPAQKPPQKPYYRPLVSTQKFPDGIYRPPYWNSQSESVRDNQANQWKPQQGSTNVQKQRSSASDGSGRFNATNNTENQPAHKTNNWFQDTGGYNSTSSTAAAGRQQDAAQRSTSSHVQHNQSDSSGPATRDRLQNSFSQLSLEPITVKVVQDWPAEDARAQYHYNKSWQSRGLANYGREQLLVTISNQTAARNRQSPTGSDQDGAKIRVWPTGSDWDGAVTGSRDESVRNNGPLSLRSIQEEYLRLMRTSYSDQTFRQLLDRYALLHEVQLVYRNMPVLHDSTWKHSSTVGVHGKLYSSPMDEETSEGAQESAAQCALADILDVSTDVAQDVTEPFVERVVMVSHTLIKFRDQDICTTSNPRKRKCSF